MSKIITSVTGLAIGLATYKPGIFTPRDITDSLRGITFGLRSTRGITSLALHLPMFYFPSRSCLRQDTWMIQF